MKSPLKNIEREREESDARQMIRVNDVNNMNEHQMKRFIYLCAVECDTALNCI